MSEENCLSDNTTKETSIFGSVTKVVIFFDVVTLKHGKKKHFD
jgi:hypothetical protein